MFTGRVLIFFPGQHPCPSSRLNIRICGNKTPLAPLMNVAGFLQPYLFLTRLKFIFDAPPVFMVYWFTRRLGP